MLRLCSYACAYVALYVAGVTAFLSFAFVCPYANAYVACVFLSCFRCLVSNAYAASVNQALKSINNYTKKTISIKRYINSSRSRQHSFLC